MKHCSIVAFVTITLLFQSCCITRLQPVQRDSVYVARVDSVMIYDSIYVDRIRTIKEKADTVYVTDVRVEYKYKYRDRVKTDTLFVDREVKTVEVREVDKPLGWGQKFRLDAFWWLAAAIALWVIWKLLRKALHL